MAAYVVVKRGVIVAAGYSNYEEQGLLGPDEVQYALPPEIEFPLNIMTHYFLDPADRSLKARVEPIDLADVKRITNPADFLEDLHLRLEWLIVRRLLLKEMNRDVTEITQRIAQLKGKIAAIIAAG